MLKERRRFLEATAKGAAGTACAVLGIGLLARPNSALPATALRPPGALAEEDFRASCVRCGLCVRACPYDTLKLADIIDDAMAGTPFFEARSVPCELCEDIPCKEACPTGALDPGLVDIEKARMGLAVLVDRETCLNAQGLRCDVCYRVCPLIDEAITLELSHNARTEAHAIFMPEVHSDACTGCGKCEQACVLPEAAIKVLPMHLAKGASAEHYRLGWEEKKKAGEALVDGIVDLPDRGYDGMPSQKKLESFKP
ncbi:MAG: ferredoxin-type protein NapG [Geminicoccaceae bacterium]